MAWRQFWKRKGHNSHPDLPGAPIGSRERTTAVPTSPAAHDDRGPIPLLSRQDSDRLAIFKRKRLACLYDIEQGELAKSADNPWSNRITLLTEALGDVETDIVRSTTAVPGPYVPLPDTPILTKTRHEQDVITVSITIGDVHFTFEEDEDWAERGHQIARTELRRTAGDPAAIVPSSTPSELRAPLGHHLGDSLFVFATDIRDRLIEGSAMPASPTLADLARPCPECGGWTDWRGTCQACSLRRAAAQRLKREQLRLLDERTREAEERYRLVERLPLARRRLHDTDIEINAITGVDG